MLQKLDHFDHLERWSPVQAWLHELAPESGLRDLLSNVACRAELAGPRARREKMGTDRLQMRRSSMKSYLEIGQAIDVFANSS